MKPLMASSGLSNAGIPAARKTARPGSAPPVAEPDAQNGPLAAVRLVRLDGLDHRLGRLRTVGQRRRAIHDQDRVRALVGEHGLDGLSVPFGLGVTDDVDRVGMRPGRR